MHIDTHTRMHIRRARTCSLGVQASQLAFSSASPATLLFRMYVYVFMYVCICVCMYVYVCMYLVLPDRALLVAVAGLAGLRQCPIIAEPMHMCVSVSAQAPVSPGP